MTTSGGANPRALAPNHSLRPLFNRMRSLGVWPASVRPSPGSLRARLAARSLGVAPRTHPPAAAAMADGITLVSFGAWRGGGVGDKGMKARWLGGRAARPPTRPPTRPPPASPDVDGTLGHSVGARSNWLHKQAFSHACKEVYGLDTNM